MLKYEVPAVYGIIMDMTPKWAFGEPPLLLIKTICGCSDDPSFRKEKFARYLEEYAKQGLYCKRPKILTERRKAYYESIRNRKLNKYIQDNKNKISTLVNYKRKLTV